MNLIDNIISIFRILKKIQGPLTSFLGGAWALGGLLLAATGSLDFIQLALANVATNLTGVADFSALAVANYLLPVNQLIGYISAYISLLIVCAGIRIVKSWIPTVS